MYLFHIFHDSVFSIFQSFSVSVFYALAKLFSFKEGLLCKFAMFMILFVGSTRIDEHASIFLKTNDFTHTVHLYSPSV